MPLRDHFHPPLTDRRSWDGLHGQWPAMIVIGLNQKLPPRFVAEPYIHLGSSFEIDVATYDETGFEPTPADERDNLGGVAVATGTAQTDFGRTHRAARTRNL